MADTLEKRYRKLRKQLPPPKREAGSMAGQAEDLLLLRRVAEAVFEEDADHKIFEKVFARVSVLKHLPYSALFELYGGECHLRAEYAAFQGAGPSGAKLALPEEIDNAVVDRGGSPHGLAWDVPLDRLTFGSAEFAPKAILALPCFIRHRPLAVLVFADDRRSRAQLRALLPLLLEMGRVIRNRLEQLALMRDLSDMNRALEKRVDERTAALAEINRTLEKEISEHREAQASLRQATAALENTSEGIMITDDCERIVAVNRAFTDITGYESAEVVGKTPRMLHSERQEPAFFADMWQTLRATDRWQGEIWNRRKDGAVYPALLNLSAIRDDAGKVTHYSGVFSDLSAVKESEARLDHLAHYDELTGLPNRLLFRARIEHAIAQAAPREGRIAVLILGVDGFKHINESLGHPAGDELLRRLAARLIGLTREGNTVARRGGDEFGILLEGVPDSESAGRAVWNVFEGIANPFEVDGKELFLTCSAGISVFPDDGADFTTLVQNAEIALHRAKLSGSRRYQFYTAEMTQRAYQRFILEAELRRAFLRREFVLHFQPQFSLATNELAGVEALARWQHPERGLVSPASFIAIAEETGLMDGLGVWAVREACQQAVAWQSEARQPVRVAVNLSTRQIASSGMVETVSSALQETGLSPDLLELEITEGFLMEQPDAARRTLQDLKDLGVTLAIDDFGTGYSSLSYLKLYPVDRLKIDQSFVRDISSRADDQAIARAIITLGHGLSMKVMAEGVETKGQADFLRSNACDEVQGFFYGRPMPAADLGDFLQKRMLH